MSRADDEAQARARLLACAVADFEVFCRSLIIIAPKDGKRAFLNWNAIQRKYCARRTWRDVVLKPRQIGFTTLELARDVWRFLQPGQRVLVVCQTVADSAPPWKKISADIKRMLEGLRAAGLDLKFDTESEAMWTLPARDSSLQIIEAGASEGAAGKKARGGTLSRIHLTEAAFYEHAELTTNAMFEGVPSLPDTEIVIESTPNGVGNWFAKMYADAEAHRNGYRAHFFPWFDDAGYALPLEQDERITPATDRERELVRQHHISPEQLKWYRAKVDVKGPDLVDQEYATDPVRCFLTSGRNYFAIDKIDVMAGKMSAPLEDRDGLRVWAMPEPWRKYVIGVDPAEGLGVDGDWSDATVWERRTRKHVATLRNKLQPNPLADQLLLLAIRFNNAVVAIERNKGMAVIAALERIGYSRLYYDADNKPGIATTVASRPVMLEDLANGVRDGSLQTSDPELIREMRAFVVDPNTGKPYAPSKKKKDGIGDDGILSAAMAWRAMLEPEPGEVLLGDKRVMPSAVEFGGERGF